MVNRVPCQDDSNSSALATSLTYKTVETSIKTQGDRALSAAPPELPSLGIKVAPPYLLLNRKTFIAILLLFFFRYSF